MTSFREKIREKIADASLQAALDANAERRVKAREIAWSALPDWRERRQRAHRVRADVIDHLEAYLDQFTAKVRANGIQVHYAADAAEAVRLVLEIADNSRVNSNRSSLLFAKAKSMLSEEIGLNKALEAAGQRVVETDLGEYIVQLRGERPAHIITPAVHLRRGDVGKLFHEKLGIAYTEDIPTLTNTARAILREVFMTADVGLSGVNFGIAETGTLTLVTNEGNGRMCTSLPPVHIALMGMERLLPGLDDLALFLSLLPRSATGQKLSVYTQLLHRPETGQQKHLILVDNGRSALRNSPLRESLYCIRCGACLNACPVFRELGGHAYVGASGESAPYPGPIGSVISPGLQGGDFIQLAQASSLCGACKEACPVDIDLPKLLLRVRAGQIPPSPGKFSGNQSEIAPQGLLGLALAGFSHLAAHPRLYALAQKLAGWASIPLPAYVPLPEASGWGFSKDMPKPAAHPFREKFVSSSVKLEGDIPYPQPVKPAPVPVVSSTPADLSANELADLFTSELQTLGGQVYAVRAEEFPARLAGLLNERGIQHVQKGSEIPLHIVEELRAQRIVVQSTFSSEVQAGITGALAGIADTGTLVLVDDGNGSLRVSLLPEIHIAILSKADILPNLEVALRLPQVSTAPSTVLVSGPSRTADIEMTLTIGVHGPREVHVFIVDASAGK